MNEKFNEILEGIGEELEAEEERLQDNINETIENISKIIRFIDGKIITRLTHDINSRGNLRAYTEYYEENEDDEEEEERYIKGILIYENIQEFTTEKDYQGKYFTSEDNIPADQKIRRIGRVIYLTRDEELIEFTYEEEISPGHPERHYMQLDHPRELEIEEMLEENTDFETKFYGCFKKVIINAIEKNPKKKGILQKIIIFINNMEQRNPNYQED
jgi:hypothetical protein